MKLKQREQLILMITGAIIGLLILDSFIVTPFLASRSAYITRREVLTAQVAEAKQTLLASEAARRRWARYKSAGLQTDASATENNMLTELRKWSVQAKLTLASIRPDRAMSEKGLQEMSFQASAQGTMRTISSFVYQAETTQLPIRIREIQIASRTEATDDLNMQMRISTLWEDNSTQQPGTR